VKRIAEDEERLNDILAMQEFAALPVVRGLIDQCRRDILLARKAPATKLQLDEKARTGAVAHFALTLKIFAGRPKKTAGVSV